MSLGYGILGFLHYAPMSGYELAKAFGASLNFFWHAQNSQIYLELKKLEKMGYITGNTVVQESRPSKRVFTVTETGKNAFLEWLLQENREETTQFKSAFLMKVFFGGNLTLEQSTAMLGQFKADCESYMRKMESVPMSIENYGANKEDYQILFWEFTADFGYCFIKTCIAWAERCIARLEELK